MPDPRQPEEALVRQAVDGVEEPELRRPLGELGMVHGVASDGGTVLVTIAAPLPGDILSTSRPTP